MVQGRFTISEHGHESLVILDRLFMAQDPHCSELLVQCPPRQSTLRDIGPVETVHTIGPNHSLLLRENFDLSGTRVARTRRLGMVPSHRIERWSQSVYQDGYTVESHLSAFGVEVEVEVMGVGGDDGVGISSGVDGTFEGFLDG
jgi:hypothetical protein